MKTWPQLEAAAAGIQSLDEQQLAALYPLVAAAQDALGELAEAVEALSDQG